MRLSQRTTVVLGFAVLFVCGVGLAGEAGDPLKDADPGWLDSWQQSIEQQAEMLASAYDLDEDGVAAIRKELDARLAQQFAYEQAQNAELLKLSEAAKQSGFVQDGRETPETIELGRRFLEFTESMPLHETQTMKWLEARLPPEQAKEGHSRMQELLIRRSLQGNTQMQDTQLAAGKKAQMAELSREMAAAYNAEAQGPLPRGRVGEDAQLDLKRQRMKRWVKPNERSRQAFSVPTGSGEDSRPGAGDSAVRPQARREPPDGRGSVPPQARVEPLPDGRGAAVPPPPAPAPPLDEWDKHVAAVAERYEFDETQIRSARSILGDLRKRAYRYQTSRAEEYARAELMTDAKARGERLKELNRPLDAMFEELKQRLENLPTMAQRKRAESEQDGARR